MADILALQDAVTVLQGQLEIQVSLNRELTRRLQRLEAFLSKDNPMWDGPDAVLDKSTLTETIKDTVKYGMRIEGPVLGITLEEV